MKMLINVILRVADNVQYLIPLSVEWKGYQNEARMGTSMEDLVGLSKSLGLCQWLVGV